MNGRRRRLLRTDDSLDLGAQLALGNIEGTGNDGAERELERDHDAAGLEGAHDPTEPSQRDGTIGRRVGVFGPIERPKHPLEHGYDVRVAPRARPCRDGRDHRRGGVVVAAQPNIQLNVHVSKFVTRARHAQATALRST